MQGLVCDLNAFTICPAKDAGTGIAIPDRIRPSFPVSVIGSRPAAVFCCLPLAPAVVGCGLNFPKLVDLDSVFGLAIAGAASGQPSASAVKSLPAARMTNCMLELSCSNTFTARIPSLAPCPHALNAIIISPANTCPFPTVGHLAHGIVCHFIFWPASFQNRDRPIRRQKLSTTSFFHLPATIPPTQHDRDQP